MKPKPFDYVRAEALDEALACLAEHKGDARILAGGQSQVAMLNPGLGGIQLRSLKGQNLFAAFLRRDIGEYCVAVCIHSFVYAFFRTIGGERETYQQ